MKTTPIFLLALALTLPWTALAGPLGGLELVAAEGQAPEGDDPGPKGDGFLGVSAQPLPAARAEELKLKQGVSLTTVMPDTPAAKAGLQVGDVITQVNDQKIATMQDLSEAIQAHKEGERVTLKVLQAGKEVRKEVTLAARPPAPAGLMAGRFGVQVLPQMRMGGGLQLNFGGGALRLGDAEGSVELTGRGEAREVVVRDHGDEVVFEGPWVTPQDKAAAPPPIRQRIERIAGIFGDEGFVVPDFELPPVAPLVPDLEDFLPLAPENQDAEPVPEPLPEPLPEP